MPDGEQIKKYDAMIKVIVSDGDKIEKALKQFKRKCNNVKLVQECRKRQEFEKPSVTLRNQRIKAKYIQKLRNEEE
jgi:small subunit ribosomal protein S21